ncbi:MAG: butyrate kinase [Mogibacterium sp.]|nr:butyrate kinase [Mogibacterium sp.]
MYRLLVINPGSTSTKLAVYEDEEKVFQESVTHSMEELAPFEKIADQLDYRMAKIRPALERSGFKPSDFDVIMARGGILPPLKTGGYIVNDDMLWQLKNKPAGEHASNLGALIADEIGRADGVPAYIYDAVCADDIPDKIRYTGLPEMKRRGTGHNLNIRATAMKYATDRGKTLKDVSIIVVHMGGGASAAVFKDGIRQDMINNNDGPIAPERSGALPLDEVIAAVTKDPQGFKKKLRTASGIMGYLGTNNVLEVERRMYAGDEYAKEIYDAMIMTVAKCVGKLAVVVAGDVEAIVLTGGIAHNKYYVNKMSELVSFIAPVVAYPGEDEMRSLAMGGLRILKGEEGYNVFERVE